MKTRLSRISSGGFQQVDFFERIGSSKSGLLTSTKTDLYGGKEKKNGYCLVGELLLESKPWTWIASWHLQLWRSTSQLD